MQAGVKTLRFDLVVVKADQKELRKINRDFGKSFKFPSAKVWIEEPFKLRVESRYEDTTVVMVENDLTTVYSVPQAKLRRTRDLTHSPGGRQTFLDFGLLTPSLSRDFLAAKYVGSDGTGPIFDLTYVPSSDYKDTTRFRVWFDAKGGYIVKREWYAQDGHLLATFQYRDPKSFGGVTVPTDVVVMNGDGHFAGETRATDIGVNVSIDPKLFSVS